MSRLFSARNSANYLLHDAGSATASTFPFTYGGWFRATTVDVESQAVISHSGSTNANRYGGVGVSSLSRWYIQERSETFVSRTTSTGTLVAADQWQWVVGVVRGDGDWGVYGGNSTGILMSEPNRTDLQGDLIEQRYVSLGVTRRSNTFERPFEGRIARCFMVRGEGFTQSQVEAFAAGTDLGDIVTSGSNIYGYWPLQGGDLNDYSGNDRHMTVVGTVAADDDDPFEPPLPPGVFIRETLISKLGTPRASETGLTALIWHSTPTAESSTPNQVLVGQSTSVAGLTDWEIDQGSLTTGDPIWLSILKDGAEPIATMVKIVPDYDV
jgi:hypothetical protein